MKGHNSPKATIVIPCYNAEDWIGDCVESALSQGESIEGVIVVDDGSTDNSLQILERMGNRITVITGPNGGVSCARNKGLKKVTTKYVKFLDADDTIEGPIIEGAIEKAEEHNADIIFSEMAICYDGKIVESKGPFGRPHQLEEDIFANWFDGDWINPSATLWRSDFVREVGGWADPKPMSEDAELVMRSIFQGCRIVANDKGRTIYNRGIPGSISMSGGVTRDKLRGHIDQIEGVFKQARDAGLGHKLDRSYAALYHLGRKSFLNDYPDLGRRAQKVLRSEGHRQHHGTSSHNMICKLIGLEAKSRLFKS